MLLWIFLVDPHPSFVETMEGRGGGARAPIIILKTKYGSYILNYLLWFSGAMVYLTNFIFSMALLPFLSVGFALTPCILALL